LSRIVEELGDAAARELEYRSARSVGRNAIEVPASVALIQRDHAGKLPILGQYFELIWKKMQQ
jgi:hypothetical protein